MPFQAIPIALRSNTGSPLSKLAWLWIVYRAKFEDAPNGRAYAKFQIYDLSAFCQCSDQEAKEALEHLTRLGKLGLVNYGGFAEQGVDKDEVWVDVHLPISQLGRDERKRIKATPDQLYELVILANYECPGCGTPSFESSDYEVDHIIPQSVGGADVEENCQVLCHACNSRKRASVHWVDFLMGRKPNDRRR